ncbi:MAG: polysaccharide deacetylase family protein [Nitrosarchaeum sp.]|nr:polysaccharide deacetylase family protein [Nitrosarchaeum sp.]
MLTNMNLVFSVFFVICCSIMIQNAFGESTGEINLLIKYENGVKASVESTTLKIYKDTEQTSFREISVQSNPVNIQDLPLNHKYKIELYYNEQYQSTEYYDVKKLKNDFDITVKLPGGIKFDVFYKDGQTPIKEANVVLKSMNGKIINQDITDFNGETIRFWIPQTIGNDHYNVEVIIDPALKYTTILKIQSFLAEDVKIITNWPKIIDSAITIQVYRDQQVKVSKSDGDFTVLVVGKNGKISETLISYKGEAVISNIPVGTYLIQIISKNDGSLVASKEVTLFGKHDPIKLFINAPNFTSDVIKNQTTGKEEIMWNCNCVAFKIDNLQDFWLNDVQNNLIHTFSENKVPVTVSILGKFFGSDPKTVDFLKQQIQDKKIDVAIRGWELVDHSLYQTEEQSSSIKQTNNQIYEKIGVQSDIFSPPFGKFNNYTTNALKQNNIVYISTMIATDTPNLKSNPRHIPETSYLPNLLDDDPFLQGTVVEKMMLKIKDQQKKYGYALISTQPSDFAIRDDEFKNQTNEDKIKLLQELISNLKKNNIKIISLTDIPQESMFQKYPTWIKHVYVWYEQGKITNTELENAINNLTLRTIIIPR